MAKYLLAPRAREDLLSIVDYISRDDHDAANRWIDKFDDKCELLAVQPGIGERRPNFGEGIHSSLLGRYVIYYRPVDDGIEVIRVIAGDRDTHYL